MLKNKIIIILPIVFLVVILSFREYNHLKIKHAPKLVILKTNEVEVYENIKLKDLILSINGKLLENKKIDTTKLGKQEITFNYLTNGNIKVPYTITINIVDKTPPLISQLNTYQIPVNSKINLEKEFFCGDNYDKNPTCKIEGTYDLTQPGTYKIKLIGTDSSNNKSIQNINLNVMPKDNSQKEETTKLNLIPFETIKENYKTKNTKIGIDVSKWQGDIDFKKLKAVGIEFAYLRIGSSKKINGKPILDEKFTKNIKGFNEEKIPVGVYFYSKAATKENAKKEARWIIKELKKYQISEEIVFDWENWGTFSNYNQSFYSLTEIYKAFQKEVEKAGYKSMLYSSKNHLETIWYPIETRIWLAHYTTKTDYQGKYNVWQLTNKGSVPGIKNPVDINIKYD